MKFGIGEWKMRNGCKAVVFVNNEKNGQYPLQGIEYDEDGESSLESWNNNGSYSRNDHEGEYDLIEPWTQSEPITPQEQLTLRDQFAMAALAGMFAVADRDVRAAAMTTGQIALKTYEIADAMLAERAKPCAS